MILQKTDAYTFVRGNAGKALLKNNAKDQYEVWLKGEPGRCDIIWCYYETPYWLVFSHVASKAEVEEAHTF